MSAGFQLIIKDARGSALQSLERICSYDQVAANMLHIGATLPLQVWRHYTLTGASTYDSERTRSLSDALVSLLNAAG